MNFKKHSFYHDENKDNKKNLDKNVILSNISIMFRVGLPSRNATRHCIAKYFA